MKVTRIAEYPPEGIQDVLAWRTELGLVAYRDGQLTLKQLAAFLELDVVQTLHLMKVSGVEYVRDKAWLEQELKGAETALKLAREHREAKG